MNLVWIKNDLRFRDNPALFAAAQTRESFGIIFFENESLPIKNRIKKWGAASWYLYHQLKEFQSECHKQGIPFLYVREMTAQKTRELFDALKIQKVYSNESVSPPMMSVEQRFRQEVKKSGGEWVAFPPSTLLNWENHKTQAGQVFQVYTPFWKLLWKNRHQISVPLGDVRKTISAIEFEKIPKKLCDDILESDFFNIVPKNNPWFSEMQNSMEFGEDIALKRAKEFIKSGIKKYKSNRDIPGVDGTSRVSIDLARGSLSIRTLWHEVLQVAPVDSKDNIEDPNYEQYLKELVWREFATYILFHFTNSDTKSLKLDYENLPWENSPKKYRAWTKGLTGYPIIDAGMRQLWRTGWMHNRVRMIVGSFLVKDLNIEWQKGASWFLDTLLDADLANNSLGWQWVAGCGVDAAPYFRVFNPILQGEKFDPDGVYVKKWIPELEKLDSKFIHQPWNAPEEMLAQAKIKLGVDYPLPVVDHGKARDDILRLFKSLKKK